MMTLAAHVQRGLQQRLQAQVALQFARSCPGVATALCGMSRPEHVAENLELLGLPKAGPEELIALL